MTDSPRPTDAPVTDAPVTAAPVTAAHSTAAAQPRRRGVATWIGVLALAVVTAVIVTWARSYDGFLGGLLTGCGVGIAVFGGFALGAVYGRRSAPAPQSDWLPSRDGAQ